MSKRSSRTRCATTWNAATPSSKPRWRKFCVYREVKIIKETAAASKKKPSDAVAIVSDDEKRDIQAIAATVPELPPEPGGHATFARDHEYKRHGTVSLLAGIDLLTGAVHARFRSFVGKNSWSGIALRGLSGRTGCGYPAAKPGKARTRGAAAPRGCSRRAGRCEFVIGSRRCIYATRRFARTARRTATGVWRALCVAAAEWRRRRWRSLASSTSSDGRGPALGLADHGARRAARAVLGFAGTERALCGAA